jgi:hypothetical protein
LRRKVPQHITLMQGDVVRLVALDLILRVILARVMSVAFVVYILSVHLHDRSADPTGFRIPAHVIANFKGLFHN